MRHDIFDNYNLVLLQEQKPLLLVFRKGKLPAVVGVDPDGRNLPKQVGEDSPSCDRDTSSGAHKNQGLWSVTLRVEKDNIVSMLGSCKGMILIEGLQFHFACTSLDVNS